MKIEAISRPDGVNPDSKPVRIFLAGQWQIVWVSDAEDFVQIQLNQGYDVVCAS